jgi:hypothetical protein
LLTETAETAQPRHDQRFPPAQRSSNMRALRRQFSCFWGVWSSGHPLTGQGQENGQEPPILA